MALPPEHGGWGLLFEPILLGLVAAPSAAGALVGAAAIGVFLARQPLKLFLTDTLARRAVPRTRHAAWFASAYLGIAGLTGAAALALTGPRLLSPIVAAAPLASVQLVYDARNRSRGLLQELCGAAALALTAAAISIADDWTLPRAMALAAVAAARSVPALVTVRTRVLRLHASARADSRADASRVAQPDGRQLSSGRPLAAHAFAMLAIYLLRIAGLVPTGVVTVLAMLAVRAGISLRPSAPHVRAQRIGLEELIVGLAASVVLGVLCRRTL